MSLLASIVRPVKPQAVAPFDASVWLEAFQQAATDAGVVVTPDRALQLPAVWAAVWCVADLVGSLPLITYEKRRVGRMRADQDPVYELLHDQPNPEMTAPVCWSVVGAHLRIWGDAFLGKTFQLGEVTELWPIRPDRVRVQRRDGRKVFYIADEYGVFSERAYTSDQVIHVIGPSLDGLRGCSPVDLGKETLGAGIAMQRYWHRFYANSAIPRGVLKHKKQLSEDAKELLRRQWNAIYRGVRNAHQVAILEEDMEFEAISMSLEHQQFVELTNALVSEVARLWRVPVSAIEGSKGDSLTYSTVEADRVALLGQSVTPYLGRIEAALRSDRDLFPRDPAGRRRRYPEFLTEEYLRGDTKTRFEAYDIALGKMPWMLPSEVRERENMPPTDAFDEPGPPPGPPGPDGADATPAFPVGSPVNGHEPAARLLVSR